MHQIPPIELAIKINNLINQDKDHLKEYQDKQGKLDFNVLIGFALGAVCSFGSKLAIAQILKMFVPMFDKAQLKDYSDFITSLNFYLVDAIEEDTFNLCVLEDNKWTPVAEASFKSLYTLWYPFFSVMKVEFHDERDGINKLSSNYVASRALNAYKIMSRIMESSTFDDYNIEIMQRDFPICAKDFNELRKLIYLEQVDPPSTIH